MSSCLKVFNQKDLDSSSLKVSAKQKDDISKISCDIYPLSKIGTKQNIISRQFMYRFKDLKPSREKERVSERKIKSLSKRAKDKTIIDL